MWTNTETDRQTADRRTERAVWAATRGYSLVASLVYVCGLVTDVLGTALLVLGTRLLLLCVNVVRLPTVIRVFFCWQLSLSLSLSLTHTTIVNAKNYLTSVLHCPLFHDQCLQTYWLHYTWASLNDIIFTTYSPTDPGHMARCIMRLCSLGIYGAL